MTCFAIRAAAFIALCVPVGWAQNALPHLSDTEREAIEAGDVWWDADLFTGNPDWNKLLAFAPAKLSDEEQQFLDGPVSVFFP